MNNGDELQEEQPAPERSDSEGEEGEVRRAVPCRCNAHAGAPAAVALCVRQTYA